MVAFLPIYFVLVLPCVLYQLIRKEKSGQNVVRKFLNIEDADMIGSRDDVYKRGDANCQGEGIPLTNDHLKSRLNTRRASSIEGENEMIGKSRLIIQKNLAFHQCFAALLLKCRLTYFLFP